MQITYRIPSKKVPYGYIEFTDSTEMAGLPDPVALAEWYANFIQEYQKAEVAAFEQPARVFKPKADPVPEDDINDIAADEIKSQLGATEMSPEEAAKPWNQAEEPTESKPWSEPSSSDWDF